MTDYKISIECFVCKKKILDEHTALSNKNNGTMICMGCENAEIEVWRVSLPNQSGGYFDHDFNSMIEVLRDIDIGSTMVVSKEMIKATKYIMLPEFEGF